MKIGSKEFRATPEGKRWTKDQNLKSKYGISLLDYEALLVAQDYKCAICAKPHEDTKFGVLCVDHNHSTGKLRELLCRNCNMVIGNVGECIDKLRGMIKYLEVHNGISKPEH